MSTPVTIPQVKDLRVNMLQALQKYQPPVVRGKSGHLHEVRRSLAVVKVVLPDNR
jgi:hypothetical protein